MPTASHPTSSRVALVTGASRGIGLACARRLGQDGYRVVLAARGIESVEQASRELTDDGIDAIACPADLTRRDSVTGLLDFVSDRFGRLDVLVNNAGVLPQAQRAEAIEPSEWDRVLELNLTAPWLLAVGAKALMPPTGGVVVNVSSTAAYYPSKGLAHYNVSKVGLIMLTRVLALEWASSGVRVVAVVPGKVDTDLLEPIKEFTARTGRQLNPQRRLGQPEEVAALVSYLVSDAAAYVTGVAYPIDGGELLVASS